MRQTPASEIRLKFELCVCGHARKFHDPGICGAPWCLCCAFKKAMPQQVEVQVKVSEKESTAG